MTQRWRRLGRILDPEEEARTGEHAAWFATHAACPTALPLGGDLVRVFFSSRDERNRSHLGSVDLAIRGETIERVGPVRGPLLSPGPRGAFDADGVSTSCFVLQGDRLLAFYVGWMLGRSAPFANCIGVAFGDREGTRFEKRFVAPILGRSEANPFSLGYPWVLPIGAGWRMWFGSHLEWGAEGLAMKHTIKCATSTDGLAWEPSPQIVIDLLGARDPEEFIVARPQVLAEPWGYSMWYARRYPYYRLGYAVSTDAHAWERRDEDVVLTGPAGAWDAHEATYPCVFDHRGQRYLLYNGDGYGRTGFGIAILA